VFPTGCQLLALSIGICQSAVSWRTLVAAWECNGAVPGALHGRMCVHLRSAQTNARS